MAKKATRAELIQSWSQPSRTWEPIPTSLNGNIQQPRWDIYLDRAQGLLYCPAPSGLLEPWADCSAPSEALRPFLQERRPCDRLWDGCPLQRQDQKPQRALACGEHLDPAVGLRGTAPLPLPHRDQREVRPIRPAICSA